ncbi:hypothetical protein [Bacillus pumilus]|nr:hypothetical protein [Bacillus pumilus]
MRREVMVIGGYGDVGEEICVEVREVYGGEIVGGGRRYEKGEKF